MGDLDEMAGRFNLGYNLMNDKKLRANMSNLMTRLADLEGGKFTGVKYMEERNRIMTSIWKDCGFNFSLLAGYFFPSYPKGSPLSMLDRPFNMALMFSLPYWTFTLRGSRQIGKAQPYSEPIPTPDGWLLMGDLKVGDPVFGSDGRPCKVLAIFEQGEREVYDVIFEDGSTTRCEMEHNWKTKRPGRTEWEVETLNQITARDGFVPDPGSAVRIPLSSPVYYEPVELPISPYRIGDSLRGGGQPSEIPEAYKRCSIEQRTELLRGLVGTSGEAPSEFHSQSEKLARDVAEIAESLGGSARIKSRGNRWEVRLSGTNIRPAPSDYESGRKLEKVVSSGREECRCISVDSPDNTYLTRHYIVTHNTTTLGVRGRIASELVRRLSSLYVAPHTEPLKTFARKFDEINQAFRNEVQDQHRFAQNLYFRKYPSGAQYELLRVQTSSTPARGKSCDELQFDECNLNSTPIMVAEPGCKIVSTADFKSVRIDHLRGGETILAFDTEGRKSLDLVVAAINKGHRPVWKIVTTHGAELTCTANEKIRTKTGWIYLADILPHSDLPYCEKASAIRGLQSKAEEVVGSEEIRLLTLDGWDAIASVEYAGVQEVWDIETEKHHTFFAGGIGVHNCQLFDPKLETEVLEVLQDSDMPSVLYTGTSTTFDTLLEKRYQEGTQATWNILLDDGRTIDCGSPEAVLPCIGEYFMVDPQTKKRIDPLRGFYKFNNPEAFANRNFSIHIPQVINPDIANVAVKWNNLYRTLQRDPDKFVQEKLGIPVESGSREITEDDLKRLCVPEIVGDPDERKRRAQKGYYRTVVSAMDWGGSDYNILTKTKESTTTHVILGVTPENTIHVLHARRHGGMDYKTIMNLIAKDHNQFRAGGVASDYGVGETYHELMRSHPSFNTGRHIIFHYTGPRSAICNVMKGSLANTLNLNRTESLTSLILAMTMADPMILCGSWLEMEEFLQDFLNIHRVLSEKEGDGGQRQFRYMRDASKRDDMVHAMNFGYSLLRLTYNQILMEDEAARQMVRASTLGSDKAAGGSFHAPNAMNKLMQEARESWNTHPEDHYHTSDYHDYE